jgi:hypothetical protein
MKSTISFAALALVNNISAVEINRRAIPDGYTFNYGNLETSIKDTHDAAEAARQAAVNAQEAADAWRKGSTPNSGPVLSLNQRRAIPDGYTFNYGNLETSIHDTHTAAEAARQAAVNAQEAADAWRKGSTPNSGPVLSLSQDPADYDTYGTTFGKLADSLKERQDKYYARVLWGNQQEEEYNAWRGIPYTPTKKDLGLESLAQGKAIPDGYHHNYDILESSILNAHSTAEDARQAAVNAQEAADVWRKGSTPNSGPVYPYGLSQRRAIPDGYTFNYGNLETSIHDTHTAAEASRQAAVNAQEAADAWRKGATPNSGPVLSLNQKVNPADPDTYATRAGELSDSLKDRQDKYYARVLWGNQ